MRNNYTLKELLNSDLVFIDLEANQEVIHTNSGNINKHYLLELCGIKYRNGKKVDSFNESVYQSKPLNKQVSSLLNKPSDYYQNTDFLDEYNVYKEFLNFTHGATVIAYGDYDQIVLNAVAQRTRQQKVYILDVCEEIKKNIHISHHLSPSLSGLAYAFGIDQEKYNKHEADADAQLLFDIFLAYLSSDKDKIHFRRECIINELIRPTKYKEFIKTPNKVEVKIEKDYKYVFDSCELRKKIEYVDNTKEVKRIYYTSLLNIRVYDRDGKELIKYYQDWETYENEKQARQVLDDTRKAIIDQYGTNLVFINKTNFKKSYMDILTTAYDGQLPLIYVVSHIPLSYVLQHNVDNDISHFIIINKLNKFYNAAKKDFSNIIDYDAVFNL